jgi:hypothetical protein
MSDHVSNALLDTGELGVVVVPGGIVVPDQGAVEAGHHLEGVDRLRRAGVDRGVPDQAGARGPEGHDVRAASQLRAVVVDVPAQHVDRGLVRAQHRLGDQRVLHPLVEAGRRQVGGEPLGRAGDEPGRHRHPQQGLDQHRGPLDRHVALGGQQHRRAVEQRPVGHTARPCLPHTRHRRGRDLPAAAAPPPRQHPLDLLQQRCQHVPDLRPGVVEDLGTGQVRLARRALRRRVRR